MLACPSQPSPQGHAGGRDRRSYNPPTPASHSAFTGYWHQGPLSANTPGGLLGAPDSKAKEYPYPWRAPLPQRGDSDLTLGGGGWLLGLHIHNLRAPLPAPPPGKGADLRGKGGGSMSNQVTEE